MVSIPENEIEIKFIRASGPGGQNVNRRSTKVQLRWNIVKSQIISEEQKERLFQSRFVKTTKAGDIIIESDETRHQEQNREIAIWRLNELVNQALKQEKKRISTKPSKSAKERRLDEKKKKSEKKRFRQKVKYF